MPGKNVQMTPHMCKPTHTNIDVCLILIVFFFFVADTVCDLPIDSSNTNQYIVWAVGGLGVTAFKHFSRAACKQIFRS